jgi:peptide-methionine (S)-S-oxide reductase
VQAFFASHDPTSINRQGQDVGTEYRSIAFYRNLKEKKRIDEELERLARVKKFKNKIVTEVKLIDRFYAAEEFHQEYVKKHPDNEYVKYVSLPEFLAFKISFEAKYKPINYGDY